MGPPIISMFDFLKRKRFAQSKNDIPVLPVELEERFDSLLYYLESDVPSLKKVHAIYTVVDELRLFLRRYFPCKKGCSYCCSIPVDVYSIEAEYISNKIGQSVFHNVATNRYSSCPFLKKYKCSIYENRPFKCRSLFAYNGPASCKMMPFEGEFRKYGLKAVVSGEEIEILHFLEAKMDGMSEGKFDIRELFDRKGC